VSAPPRRSPPGSADTPLSVTAAPVQAAAGFESVAPVLARKRQSDPGTADSPLRAAGALTAAVPLGWESQAPTTTLRRKVADRGWQSDALPLPPSVPFQFVAGWLPVAPERARKVPTQPGDYALALRALVQPAAPQGAAVVAPDRAQPKRPAAPGWADSPVRFAAVVAAPSGFSLVYPDRAQRRRPTDTGMAVVPVRSLAVSVPSGWRMEYPTGASRPRRADPGAVVFVLRALVQPVARWSWEPVAPVSSTRRIFNRVEDAALVVSPPAAAPFGWSALAPDFAARRPADPGWVSVFGGPSLFIVTNTIPLTAELKTVYALKCQAGAIIPLTAEVVTVYRLKAELEQ
jgi:hypothetical protein